MLLNLQAFMDPFITFLSPQEQTLSNTDLIYTSLSAANKLNKVSVKILHKSNTNLGWFVCFPVTLVKVHTRISTEEFFILNVFTAQLQKCVLEMMDQFLYNTGLSDA